MKHYDFLVVGAGLFGSVFAYRAKAAGKKCLVIDKRSHLGGNIYCENMEGINVHKYGAHIFHTSNKIVWNFVNTFVDFNRYVNSPLAFYQEKLYNLPFNMNTFYQMWGIKTPVEAENKIAIQKKSALCSMQKAGIVEPRNLEEQAISLIGEDIYEKLIKGYTEKQWGRCCVDLPAFIIKRLPVRFTFDNNYFNDMYQGIPIGGYNKLIQGLLADIDTYCNANFFEDRSYYENIASQVVFTGAIDEFYDFCFGNLEYRTIRFETDVLDIPNFQGNAVVNYTDRDVPYTRIIEHKHFEMFGTDIEKNRKTVISKEYSSEWQDGSEPYYPINDQRNMDLYFKYKQLATQESKTIFGGRLAEYKYYDMHQIIEMAMSVPIK